MLIRAELQTFMKLYIVLFHAHNHVLETDNTECWVAQLLVFVIFGSQVR